jgi:hypothetical protein
MKLDPVK